VLKFYKFVQLGLWNKNLHEIEVKKVILWWGGESRRSLGKLWESWKNFENLGESWKSSEKLWGGDCYRKSRGKFCLWGRLQHIPSYRWLSYTTYSKSGWLSEYL